MQQLTDMQAMMVADGLPASLLRSKEEREAAWAKAPPPAYTTARLATTTGMVMTYEGQRRWWLHQLTQLRARQRVQGNDVTRERKAAQRELAKLRGLSTYRAEQKSKAAPAAAATRAQAPVANPRPQPAGAMGRSAGAAPAMQIVKGIDSGGLVTADDLGREFGVPAKLVRRLLRTHKPVPKPSWGWSFDAETVTTVRNWLATKLGKTIATPEATAVSREENNAPAPKQTTKKSAKHKAKSRHRS